MSYEESKLPTASGGISEEEVKLLHALHLLGIKPKVDSADDLAKLVKAFGNTEPSQPASAPVHGNYHFPKLSTFYGEDGKGDVNWETFKYEIEALVHDHVFSNEQILLGIRRACKGKAADSIRRLGPKVALDGLICKFESDYGSVASREVIMKQFYSCHQKEKESVSSYAARLEEIFDQAIYVGALRRTDVKILKDVFHNGLIKDLKLMSMYQFDQIDFYDDFKREIRKLESTLMDEDETVDSKKPCKASVNVHSQSKEMSEVKDLLTKLHERIDKLEKERDDRNAQSTQSLGRGFRGNRHHRGRGRGNRGRGRGDYKPQLDIGNQTFQPTCWTCNQQGHVQRNCPMNVVVCYNCNQPGHKQNNCPNA